MSDEFKIRDIVRHKTDERQGKITKVSEACGTKFYHIPSIGTCGFVCKAHELELVYRPTDQGVWQVIKGFFK